MNINHIRGMLIRNFYLWFRDLDRLFDTFWWAFFDVVIWGFFSTYFSAGGNNIVARILSGTIFWAVLARSQWEVSASMITESWERNLMNVFASPLTIAEFLTSSVLLGAVKLLVVFSFMAGVTILFYHFNIFALSFWIIPLLGSLFFTSVWLAFFVNALVLRYGKGVISVAWTLIMIINPISGVVYPLSVLPRPLQMIAQFIPSSYVFEGMRSVLETGTMNPSLLLVSFILNAVYLMVAIFVYWYTFRKAREHGWLIKLA